MTYCIILIRNSPDSSKAFLPYKKVIRNKSDAQERESCGEMLKNFH